MPQTPSQYSCIVRGPSSIARNPLRIVSSHASRGGPPETVPPSPNLSCARKVTWPEADEPPPPEPRKLRACLDIFLRDRLAAAVRRVSLTPEAAPFAVPVEVEDYASIVPVPMDLGLILRRLEKV